MIMKFNMKKVVYLLAAIGVSGALAGSYDDFFRAVVRDDAPSLKAWVGRGFDPNARDPDGHPAIIRALRADSFDAALALARMPGLDANARNASGETPLMMAAMKGQIEVCLALLEQGAQVNPGAGWTPLHYAASGNSLPAVRLLLERGAHINARAPNRSTALMMAAQYAAEEVIGVLLATGADPALRDKNDATAADLARAQGRDRLADELAKRASAGRAP